MRGTQRRLPPKCIETLFRLFRSTFRSLEMHSKRRYKICTCSVILGELEPFRNYKGFNIIFSKNLEAIYAINERKNFSDSSLNHIFESENFRFPFLYKRWPNLGSEMWKIKIQKVKGNLLEKLRKLYVHKRNGHLEIFSRPQVIENSRQYLLLRRDIHRKRSLGAPGTSFQMGRKEQTETSHNY